VKGAADQEPSAPLPARGLQNGERMMGALNSIRSPADLVALAREVCTAPLCLRASQPSSSSTPILYPASGCTLAPEPHPLHIAGLPRDMAPR
jgi:hypothetical protein